MTIGSPLGRYSPWRFMRASDLGYPNRPCVPARMVPQIFGRMTVVSNMRTLTNGGTNMHVNIGPTLVGRPPPGIVGRPTGGAPAMGPTLGGRPPMTPPAFTPGPAPARLAAVAPQALPRYAITPRIGYPVAARPWIQAGIVRPVPRFGPSPGLAWNAPEQRSGGYGRMSVPGPYGQPAGGIYRAGPGFSAPGFQAGGGFRAPGPAFRGGSAPFRGASPTFRGAPAPAFRGAPPVFRGAAPAPVFRGAPAAPAPHVSAPAFSHPSGGFRPSFGGGGGGGHAFGGGGGRSFGGGHRR
jgi:hypothetical protein